jgi:hypothetical protein
MSLNRTAVIQRYLDARDKDRQEIYRVPFKGQATELPVIRVDVKDLRFNVNLGRLILERISGAKLEPDDPKAQGEIQRLLLDQTEAKELRSHIQEEGQLQPGIVSRDGTLINGNRRLAVLRSLWPETNDERFKYMNVAVLPKDATPGEMYLLEVNLQMTPETRARYGPITALKQLRFGLEKYKLDKGELAHAMYLPLGDVEDLLERLQIVDEYLAFIKRPTAYGLLEKGSDEADHQGKYEHFVTLHRLKQMHGDKPYWEAFQRHVFQLIRSGSTFQEIRVLKKWKTVHVAALATRLGAKPPATPKPAKGRKTTKRGAASARDDDLAELAAGLTSISESLSPEAAEAAAGLPLPKGPAKPEQADEADPEKDPELSRTVDAVAAVNEQVQTERASKRPTELLRQALTKMEAYLSLTGKAGTAEAKQLRELVDKIAKVATKIKKTLSKR